MTQCGTEELSEHDVQVALRIRITLYKVQQELIYDTISDPMHYKSVIPVLIQDLQDVCAAIESLENMNLKIHLGHWYNEVREHFMSNENVQSFVFNAAMDQLKGGGNNQAS